MIEVIAVFVLLTMTAVVSFGVGSAVGYKAGKKVTQFHAVKRGAEVAMPIARQLFSQFATPATKSDDEWLSNEYN